MILQYELRVTKISCGLLVLNCKGGYLPVMNLTDKFVPQWQVHYFILLLFIEFTGILSIAIYENVALLVTIYVVSFSFSSNRLFEVKMVIEIFVCRPLSFLRKWNSSLSVSRSEYY